MDWTSILITVIGAAASIITVLVENGKTKKVVEQTAAEAKQSQEVNDFKTYLLLLISNYPKKADEIYYVARHYFEDLNGDSFVLPIFEDWLTERGDSEPEWFLKAKEKHPKK